MRLLPALAILPLLLAAAPVSAPAGTVTVDPSSQVVETSRLRVQFDRDYPEMVRRLVFKDWDTAMSLVTTEASFSEFWGQTYAGPERPGFLQSGTVSAHSWQVTAQTAKFVQILITSQSADEPAVQTRYTFFADLPYFAVDRTIFFSTHPDTAAYQAYVPRMAFLADYRALRWRAADGTLLQRGFCLSPCVHDNWDGRWLQELLVRGSRQLSIATLFPLGQSTDSILVRAYGPLTNSGWVAPLVPAGAHLADATWSELVAFSTNADDAAAIDALWSAYQGGSVFVGVAPDDATPPLLRLAVAPNPARAGTRIDWSCPAGGRVRLEVLDVSGRRVAEPFRGTLAPGPHSATWDGSDAAGTALAPGLYFVRLTTPAGVRCARLVRAQ